MIENVLVKVDKFIFPVDFVIMDMKEDQDCPLLLRRPFLAIGHAMSDMESEELLLGVQNEEFRFNVFEAMRFPNEDEAHQVDSKNELLEELPQLEYN